MSVTTGAFFILGLALLVAGAELLQLQWVYRR
jgi:hypothetical protein